MSTYRFQAPRLRAEPKPEPPVDLDKAFPGRHIVTALAALWFALILGAPAYVLVRAASDLVAHPEQSLPLGTGVNPGLDGSVD